MVNRFTPKAQAVLSTAKKCAEKMGHCYIGTEHILLGILSCECVGKKFLEDKKIFYSLVYDKLVEIAGIGNREIISASELTPKCKKIIESSSVHAKRFGTKLIGTEHILYAICEEQESVGGRILTSLGANLQILKNELATHLDIKIDESKQEKHVIAGAPTLSIYGKSLNYYARLGKCDPVIGREQEIDRLIQILSRRTKNNPCLIGEPGVGKTAIVEGLAHKINMGDVPQNLLNKTIVSLDLSSMVAGAKYRGEFEERMRNVMNELRGNDSLILFIDEIHTIIGAGAAEGAVDAANIIKPALARAELQLIGATTIAEYRKHIEKDAALERRFQPIMIKEPSYEESIRILKGLRGYFEHFHGVKIPDKAIESAVKLSIRYIPDRFLPDKAIDIIDEACSKIKTKLYARPEEIRYLEERLSKTREEKERAILGESYEEATSLREEEVSLKIKLTKAKKEHEKAIGKLDYSISESDVEEIVSVWSSVPVARLEQDERERLNELEKDLCQLIIGQDAAVKTVASSIRRGRAGLKNPKRPLGSFLFLGPTGVGKTELAKCIAKTVFESDNSLIRIDMSEYTEKHSISRLLGSPPGYVGYNEGGQLTSKIRTTPHSVVLFDEIEKAHPDIYNILLQILEDGTLTDSQGRSVDFKNAIIIITSNIGAKNITESRALGFSQHVSAQEEDEKIRAKINDELKREFRPEFLNRLDEIVIFNRLSLTDIGKITMLMLKELALLGKDIGIELDFDKSAIDFIAKIGYDKSYGARPIRRTITSYIENPLSEKILAEEIKKGDRVSVFCKNGKILFDCSSLSII